MLFFFQARLLKLTFLSLGWSLYAEGVFTLSMLEQIM